MFTPHYHYIGTMMQYAFSWVSHLQVKRPTERGVSGGPKQAKKKSLTVTSLECCCCYVDKEICKHCFLLNYKFNFNIFPIKYARSSTFFCSVQLKPTHAVIDFCPKQWKQASGDSDLINREGLHNF